MNILLVWLILLSIYYGIIFFGGIAIAKAIENDDVWLLVLFYSVMSIPIWLINIMVWTWL